ncbi:MAG TPA: hypothetical protein ENH82_04760 [bacterium]|nr:hypothetical protein [bacterium]
MAEKNSALDSTGIIAAFVNVHVVPMDSERIIKNQTVIVKNGIITDIGNNNTITIPEKAAIIDGGGQYLMPGLSDMHVHITNEKDLLLFVAHGVTTVQNMWGYTGLPRLLGFPDYWDFPTN